MSVQRIYNSSLVLVAFHLMQNKSKYFHCIDLADDGAVLNLNGLFAAISEPWAIHLVELLWYSLQCQEIHSVPSLLSFLLSPEQKHTHEEWNIHGHSQKHTRWYSISLVFHWRAEIFKTMSNMSLMENPSSGLFLQLTHSRQSNKYTQPSTVYSTPPWQQVKIAPRFLRNTNTSSLHGKMLL